jgi:release factor glutamine methyltransferase
LESRAEVYATDVSQAAIAVARENAHTLGARVHFVHCDLASPFATRSADMMVSNPPYVSNGDREGLQREVRDWEPRVALFAGPTGLEIYERLAAEAERVLKPGGYLVVELGYLRTLVSANNSAPEWLGL